MCATLENFTQLSGDANPPTVLHFVGHGQECDKNMESL